MCLTAVVVSRLVAAILAGTASVAEATFDRLVALPGIVAEVAPALF